MTLTKESASLSFCMYDPEVQSDFGNVIARNQTNYDVGVEIMWMYKEKNNYLITN